MSVVATSASGAPHLGRRWPRRIDPWLVLTLALTVLVAVPLVTLVVQAASTSGVWTHLLSTVLPVYTGNTLALLAGVAFGTVFIGTSTAWLVTMYAFPGRRLLSVALLLPLAVPSYILAFVITDQLEYAGPVQSALRAAFGWSSARDYWFPEIRSIGGATVVLSLVLYPYVYLLARAAFLEQCFCLFEVSRTLGRSPWKSFLSVALPLARPAIAVGAALALMETLNEYGTVEFFAVPTLTVGIFDVWLNMGSRSGAAQLACLLVGLTLVLITIERMARRKRSYQHTTTRVRSLPDYPLGPVARVAAALWCLTPVVLGFVLPALVLGRYAIEFFEATLDGEYLAYAWNSIRLAAMTGLSAMAIGVLLAYGVRLSASGLMRAAVEVATVGYAIPGAVLAVGILIPLGALDNALDSASRALFDLPLGLLLSGTSVALVVGYTARFMALSYRTVDASLVKITPSMEGASRTLGAGPLKSLLRIHLPLVRPSVLTAALLVFVDTMKELPLTLILRPFNFETLATFVYQYASEELLEECALGALTIVVVGVAPVIVLSRTIASSRPGHA